LERKQKKAICKPLGKEVVPTVNRLENDIVLTKKKLGGL